MGKDYKKAIKDKRLEAGNLMTKKQIAQCNAAIHTASVAAGASGGIPIPVADAIPITAAQVTMVIALGKIFDQEITSSAAKAAIAAAASTFVGRNLVKLIPIAGWVVSAAVAAGVTEAIGWTIAVDMAKNYRKEWARKKAVEEAVDLAVEVEKNQHIRNDDEVAEDISEDSDSSGLHDADEHDAITNEDRILKIKIKDRDVQIVNEYQQLESTQDTPPDSVVFGTETETIRCVIMLFPIESKKAMPFGKQKKVIDSIHQCLDDGQGLIEVETGKTKGGSRFVYSIVKTKLEPFGVQYTLRAHIDHPNGPIEILAFFEEAGMTGQRDAVVFQIARSQKLVDQNMNGWMKDPYTPDYKKGLLMNLSEQRKFDQHFPGHPLTELRKYIDAFIENN